MTSPPRFAVRSCLALALLLALLGCSSDDDGGRDAAAAGGSGGRDGGTSGAHDGGGGSAGHDGGAGGGAGTSGNGGHGGNAGHDAGLDAGDGGTGDADAGADAATNPARCEGPLMITSDQEFAELVAERCRVVTAALRITQTDTLTSLEGLVVERVEGDLVIAANAALRTLAGLERLARVDGNLSIVNNAALESLDPLTAWAPETVAGTLSIFQNESLPQCAVDALDAQLSASCDNCAGNDAEGVCE